MAEPMNMMRDDNVANPLLDTGMPKEAKDVMMKPSEGIKNALLMRLSNMTPDELRMLDESNYTKGCKCLNEIVTRDARINCNG
jgi:hypothetical protein